MFGSCKTEAIPMSRAFALKLVELRLLVRSQDLVESGMRLALSSDHLGRQVAYGSGRLGDPILVIVLDCGLQALMCRLHAVMKATFAIGRIGEYSCCLLLLLRGERQHFGQVLHMVLNVRGWIRRFARSRALSQHD